MILKKIKQKILTQIKIKDINIFTYPPNPEMGDLSLPCFDLAKKEKKNPAEVAEDLKNKIKIDSEIISEIKVIGPYVNFFINKKYLAKKVLENISKEKEKYGSNQNLAGKRIMVEFAHPNPFKAFHIGHLRNLILGESIVRILEAQGAEIIRVNYQGDVGMHIAKCLWAFQKIDSANYPKSSDEKVALIGKCYVDGASAFEDEEIKKEITIINKKIYSKEDEKINQLWNLGKKWSLEKFHEIYKRVYSWFEREYMESEVIEDCLKYIQKAQDKKILEKSQGAIIFNGDKYGLDTRVFLNSEGLPTYDGKELGLAYKEFADFGKIDLCIHNVAVEQISFFKVNFKVQELLDKEKFKNKQYHNAYEFVGLKLGKMSSRKGDVVLGNDIFNQANEKIKEKMLEVKKITNKKEIIEKIAIGAVKYSFLNISSKKYLAFDLDESVSFSGNSGPYLQYTYARINSIFRKSEIENQISDINFENLSEDKEFALILQLAKFEEIVEKAGENYEPSEIAKYLFELTQIFNDYYHSVSVLKVEEDIKNARLFLLQGVKQVIANGLNLLGIKTVEEM